MIIDAVEADRAAGLARRGAQCAVEQRTGVPARGIEGENAKRLVQLPLADERRVRRAGIGHVHHEGVRGAQGPIRDRHGDDDRARLVGCRSHLHGAIGAAAGEGDVRIRHEGLIGGNAADDEVRRRALGIADGERKIRGGVVLRDQLVREVGDDRRAVGRGGRCAGERRHLRGRQRAAVEPDVIERAGEPEALIGVAAELEREGVLVRQRRGRGGAFERAVDVELERGAVVGRGDVIPLVRLPRRRGRFDERLAVVQHEGNAAVIGRVIDQQPVGEVLLKHVLSSAARPEQAGGIHPQAHGEARSEVEIIRVRDVHVIVHAIETQRAAEAARDPRRAVEERAGIAVHRVGGGVAGGFIELPMADQARVERVGHGEQEGFAGAHAVGVGHRDGDETAAGATGRGRDGHGAVGAAPTEDNACIRHQRLVGGTGEERQRVRRRGGIADREGNRGRWRAGRRGLIRDGGDGRPGGSAARCGEAGDLRRRQRAAVEAHVIHAAGEVGEVLGVAADLDGEKIIQRHVRGRDGAFEHAVDVEVHVGAIQRGGGVVPLVGIPRVALRADGWPGVIQGEDQLAVLAQFVQREPVGGVLLKEIVASARFINAPRWLEPEADGEAVRQGQRPAVRHVHVIFHIPRLAFEEQRATEQARGADRTIDQRAGVAIGGIDRDVARGFIEFPMADQAGVKRIEDREHRAVGRLAADVGHDDAIGAGCGQRHHGHGERTVRLASQH